MNTTLFAKSNRKTLDKEVERVLEQMNSMEVDSDEYRKAVDNLKVLCDARGVKTSTSIDINVVIAAVSTIAQILLVLNYERLGVVTSKAFGIAIRGVRSGG